jgi:hypothetical protein
MGPVKRRWVSCLSSRRFYIFSVVALCRGCCKQGHLWRREAEEEDNERQLDDEKTSTAVFHLILKVLATMMAFCLVLCGCVLAKGTLLLMLANILPSNNNSTSTGKSHFQLKTKP